MSSTSSFYPALGIIPGTLWKNDEEMKTAVKQFAVGADLLAARILGDEASQPEQRISVHHHHYSPWSFWPIWYQPSVLVVSDRPSSNEGNGAALFLLGLTAAILSGVGLYLTGGALKKYQDASRDLVDSLAMHQQLGSYETGEVKSEEYRYIEEAKGLALLQGRLSKRLANSSLIDLALRVSLTAAAIVTFTGTLLAAVGVSSILVPAFIVAGATAALVAGGGMLFRWGMSGLSPRDYREASQMHYQAKALLV